MSCVRRVKLIITDEQDEREIQEYSVDELNFRPRKKRDKGKGGSDPKKQDSGDKKEKKNKGNQ